MGRRTKVSALGGSPVYKGAIWGKQIGNPGLVYKGPDPWEAKPNPPTEISMKLLEELLGFGERLFRVAFEGLFKVVMRGNPAIALAALGAYRRAERRRTG